MASHTFVAKSAGDHTMGVKMKRRKTSAVLHSQRRLRGSANGKPYVPFNKVGVAQATSSFLSGAVGSGPKIPEFLDPKTLRPFEKPKK